MPTYQLIEIDHRLRRHVEAFDAPDDATALARIEGEPRGVRYELWCGDDLVDEGVPRFRDHDLPGPVFKRPAEPRSIAPTDPARGG